MRRRLALIAVPAALVLAACSSETADEGAPEEPSETAATSSLPDCGEVWEVGATLPDPYEGCVQDGDEVAPVFLDCTDDPERRYVEWDSGAAYATEGGPVIDTVGELARICD